MFFFLDRCHAKEMFTKKGKKIESNWKSVRTRGEMDEENEKIDCAILVIIF